MTGRFITSDGLAIAFSDEGQGLAVLCLPGLTRSMADFDELRGWPGIRLIRMDYRGRGASDRDPDWRNYTPQIEGRDALELLDHLGVPRVAIIGTSRGGIIAMGLAALVPERIAGVMLVDIGPELGTEGLGHVLEHVGRNPPFANRAEALATMPTLWPGFANVSPERWAREVDKMWVETPQGMVITYDPKLREATLAAAAAGAPDLWPFFDALGPKPVGEIWGVNSTLLTRPIVEKMLARRPDLIMAEVPDRGHVPFLDEPESVAALETFFEACA